MATAQPLLVIEDDPDIRETLQELLEAEGHLVCTASNGKEGLAAMDRMGPPCLVLLDLMMPVMDGYEFLRHLRARPDAQRFPVVLVSADRHIQDAAEHAGVVAFLRKPFDLDAILDTVKQHCPGATG